MDANGWDVEYTSTGKNWFALFSIVAAMTLQSHPSQSISTDIIHHPPGVTNSPKRNTGNRGPMGYNVGSSL